MKIKNLFIVALMLILATVTSCATTQQKNKDKETESADIEAELYDEFDEQFDGEDFGTESDDELLDAETTAETAGETILDGDPNDAHSIVISKESLTLNLYDSQGGLIYSFPVAVGKKPGNKKASGDMKTPEGEFEVSQIQDASGWGHDFQDGKGYIKNAYGNWFIRLDTYPHNGIGIHGTHDPNSIGTRATEGCIRLNNADLDKLKPLVKLGMKVTIETSIADQEADGKVDESGVNQETIDTTEEENFFDDVKKNEQRPLGEIPEDEIPVVEHTIESGDTFGGLAVKYNTTSKKIQELNPDVDPTRLQLGQKIRVKGSTKEQPAQKQESKPEVAEQKPADDANATYHTIESGDTFGGLAVKYNTTSKKIQELNPDLDPTILQLGHKVRLL